jgi:hypothetical protein
MRLRRAPKTLLSARKVSPLHTARCSRSHPRPRRSARHSHSQLHSSSTSRLRSWVHSQLHCAERCVVLGTKPALAAVPPLQDFQLSTFSGLSLFLFVDGFSPVPGRDCQIIIFAWTAESSADDILYRVTSTPFFFWKLPFRTVAFISATRRDHCLFAPNDRYE